MRTDRLLEGLRDGQFDDAFSELYGTEYDIEYQKYMNSIFGEGACIVLHVRRYGGKRVVE